jgi:hypothetical protein
MNRPLSSLSRGLLGLAFVGSLGFGATQSFATPDPQARAGSCERTGYAYRPAEGCLECPRGGYCDGSSEYCVCITLPAIGESAA